MHLCICAKMNMDHKEGQQWLQQRLVKTVVRLIAFAMYKVKSRYIRHSHI